ncbi:hypothetical protein HYE82_21110 [Streptomyces sp. BR123]|nr:hypothetical protein [Streptomyces sp. BR123]
MREQPEPCVTPENDLPMRRTGRAGRRCHWFPEIHLVDEESGFGGFCEQPLGVA